MQWQKLPFSKIIPQIVGGNCQESECATNAGHFHCKVRRNCSQNAAQRGQLTNESKFPEICLEKGKIEKMENWKEKNQLF